MTDGFGGCDLLGALRRGRPGPFCRMLFILASPGGEACSGAGSSCTVTMMMSTQGTPTRTNAGGPRETRTPRGAKRNPAAPASFVGHPSRCCAVRRRARGPRRAHRAATPGGPGSESASLRRSSASTTTSPVIWQLRSSHDAPYFVRRAPRRRRRRLREQAPAVPAASRARPGRQRRHRGAPRAQTAPRDRPRAPEPPRARAHSSKHP